MAILKLDDFIKEGMQVELKEKVFDLDISFKSFLKYLEWEKEMKQLPEEAWIGKDKEFLKIIIKPEEKANEFIELFDTLNLDDQSNVLKQLIKIWTENTLPQNLLNVTEELQKKK